MSSAVSASVTSREAVNSLPPSISTVPVGAVVSKMRSMAVALATPRLSVTRTSRWLVSSTSVRSKAQVLLTSRGVHPAPLWLTSRDDNL